MGQVRRLIGLALGRDLSQTQLAELLPNIESQSTVSRWERGTTPDADVLARLADLSGASVDWILRGQGPVVPSVAASPAIDDRYKRENLAKRPRKPIAELNAELARKKSAKRA